jgi:hypothetical protein
MTLILKRRDDMPGREWFHVLSGQATVGVISRVPMSNGGGWHWSITGFHIHPVERGVGAGNAPTLEEAQAQFASTWRSWLAWAGLQEVS